MTKIKGVRNDLKFNWDDFFKYCESLVDVKRFNNLIKWLDRKGYSGVEKYKEQQRKLF